MVLGNKKDKSNREVPYNVAMQYAMARNFGLMEVSAKTGSGVKEAFNRLVSEIYKFQTLETAIEEQKVKPTPAGTGMVSSTRTKSSNRSSVLDPALHMAADSRNSFTLNASTQDSKQDKKDCNC